jgi:CRISPR/Cas system CSM-associated protein Csm2 small subunit
MNKEKILVNIDKLLIMYKNGELGGEIMPEDANPNLEKSSLENYLYFTLPMALNYQRNSYTLWESALKTYNDSKTKFVFNPKLCLEKSFEEVQYALTKYKVALQKQKQTEIWISLCNTFMNLFDGDIRKLFDNFDNDVEKIRFFIQKENKKMFPYLSGTKICNYWLYVIYQYTDRIYKNIEQLTVAPDTHVCKATHKLGLIDDDEFNSSNVQLIVINKWKDLFENTNYKPIDIHTPLWLWSRNGFKEIK